MPSASNSESFSSLRWALKNARNGFYLYTAAPPMQRRVADCFGGSGVAVYDYSRNNAPYSFANLAKWAMQQNADVFFVINMQIALRENNDMLNLNLSRDLLTEIDGIWVFGMTADADDRLVKTAVDFYSFIRLQMHFEDDDAEQDIGKLIVSDTPPGKYYGSYDEAKKQMDRYAAMCEGLLQLPLDAEPERLLSAAMTLGTSAELHGNYGNYDHAMELYSRIVEIREKVLGKEHPDTATAYNNIALVYAKQGDDNKALEWYHKALAISEKVLGKENLAFATIYNNIADIYSHQGNYPEALEWFHKALAISEKVLGKEHPDTATAYNNIALVYAKQGDDPKALEWYGKALAIREKALGKEHPDTAVTYGNIALVYTSQGGYPEALECHHKALAVFEKALGKEHPSTATMYSNIAFAYSHQGDHLKALEWYIKSYEALLKWGENHPNTSLIRNNMSIAHRNAGLDEPFEQWLKKNLGH